MACCSTGQRADTQVAWAERDLQRVARGLARNPKSVKLLTQLDNVRADVADQRRHALAHELTCTTATEAAA